MLISMIAYHSRAAGQFIVTAAHAYNMFLWRRKYKMAQ